MRTTLSLLLLFLLGGFVARLGPLGDSIRAGTAVRLDVDGLVRGSGRVLEGRVLGSEVLEDPLTGAISTHWHLEVERRFLGPDDALTTIAWPGGVLPDGRGMLAAGMPTLATNERVLLFLSEPSGPVGWSMPVGLAQGKLRVLAQADGTRALLSQGIGLSLVEPGSPTHTHGGRYLRDYAEVVAQIHAALARRAERR